MWRPSEPSVSLMSKGLVSLDITVEGASGDLHSGRYGGTVANPLHALAEIVGLHDQAGTVAVPGFYDGIPPLTDERRAVLAGVDFSEAGYLAALGLAQGHGEAGYSTLERLWERPTLEVNGISGGGKYAGDPARRGGARVLPPGAGPGPRRGHRRDHRARQGERPGGRDHGGPAGRGPVPAYTIGADHPAIRAATAALEAVYPGQQVLLTCIPGTLPASDLFERVLGAETLFFSFSTSTRSCMRRTSSSAWPGCARGCGPGSSCGGSSRRTGPGSVARPANPVIRKNPSATGGPWDVRDHRRVPAERRGAGGG